MMVMRRFIFSGASFVFGIVLGVLALFMLPVACALIAWDENEFFWS